MSDLSCIDADELKARMKFVLERVDSIFKTIGPFVKEIGELRVESQLIYEELKKRGITKIEELDVVAESTIQT